MRYYWVGNKRPARLDCVPECREPAWNQGATRASSARLVVDVSTEDDGIMKRAIVGN